MKDVSLKFLNNKEKEGLKEIKRLRDDYLKEGANGKNGIVFEYLKNVDDSFLLQFLLGRKGNPEYAWQTIQRYAEVKLVKYPQMFPPVLPPELVPVRDCLTILKVRDDFGRRIAVFNTNCWDVRQYSLLDMASVVTLAWEKVLRDEDSVRNGVVCIQDFSNLSIKQCAQYSVKNIRQLLSIFWHSYPIRFQAAYLINTPKIMAWALSIAKLCFSKKMADRLLIWPAEEGYESLHQIFPKEVLPKFLGGYLETKEAADPMMLVC